LDEGQLDRLGAPAEELEDLVVGDLGVCSTSGGRELVAAVLVVPLEGLQRPVEDADHGLLALAVHADRDEVALVDLELEPGATRPG
jgi:hypothetical protein